MFYLNLKLKNKWRTNSIKHLLTRNLEIGSEIIRAGMNLDQKSMIRVSQLMLMLCDANVDGGNSVEPTLNPFILTPRAIVSFRSFGIVWRSLTLPRHYMTRIVVFILLIHLILLKWTRCFNFVRLCVPTIYRVWYPHFFAITQAHNPHLENVGAMGSNVITKVKVVDETQPDLDEPVKPHRHHHWGKKMHGQETDERVDQGHWHASFIARPNSIYNKIACNFMCWLLEHIAKFVRGWIRIKMINFSMGR